MFKQNLLKLMFRSLLILLLIDSLYANEKVVLQLKWFHQFQFAGYYAAKEKGFYKELGLDVEIRQRDLRYNNVEQVINNDAQYGIADSILMLYKSKKQPVVIVAPIFQHSANALISLKNSGVETPYDLDNKDTLFYPNDTDGFSLLAMMKKLDVQPRLIRNREKDDYRKLMSGEVDVVPVYLSNEPYYFQKEDIDINILNPMNYGFDFYGDMLFTNQDEVQNHPDRVKKFKEATLKGWEYALNNKEEIIQLILKKYNSGKTYEHLLYEANAIEKLITKDIIPLGTIDKGRVRYLMDIYREYGIVKKSFDIKDFIFSEYSSKVHLTKKEQEYLQMHPVLKVLNLKSFPPFNFNEQNQALGYSVDYYRYVTQLLGIDIEFVGNMNWKESLEAIKKGEIDVIPHIAINEERAEFISYTDYKHFDFQVSLAVRKDSFISSFDDLKDKTIAVMNDNFIHALLKEFYPNQKLYLAPTVQDAVEAVSNGKADAILDNLSSIEHVINKNWLSNLKTLKIKNIEHIPSHTPLYSGVTKNNLILKSILEKTNSIISYEKIQELHKKWLSNKYTTQIALTHNEYSYLKNKKTLNMCTTQDILPLEKIENGTLKGIISEYINYFSLELPINIKFQMKNQECDFLTTVLETNHQNKTFKLTKPFMKTPLVVATKFDKPFINDIQAVLTKKFAVVQGFGYKEILEKKYPTIQILEVKSVVDGLKKVIENDIYGFIDVLPVVGYSIQENFLGNLKIAGKLDSTIEFYFATKKDEPLLNDIFNKLIQTVTFEQNKNFVGKWLSVKYEESFDYTNFLYLVLVFLIILTIIMIKNRDIKKINEELSNYINIVDKNVLTSSTNKDGVITSVSQAFCDVSGYSKEELLGNKHSIIRHPDMKESYFTNLWNTILSGKVWEGEIKNKKKDGGVYWVHATISPIFDQYGNITGFTAIRAEITDKKRIEEISITDELTTLYNKRYFNEQFSKEHDRAKRLDEHLAFLILDIDFFKQYNDFYGHQKGDEVLQKVGQLLQTLCRRAVEIPFRLGGEEFGVLFNPISKEEAISFTNRLNEKIEDLQIEHEKSTVSKYVTASVGLYINKGITLDDTKSIYSFADEALYESKRNGRNRFTVYKSELS